MPDLPSPSARPALEAKFNRIALEDIAEDGSFEGYASLFGVPDQGGDVVEAGAFARSLAKRGANHIRLLFQHDPAEPIGVWATVREDEKGLFVRGRLMSEVSRGAEVLALMRAGAVDGLSIGYRTVRSRRDAARGLRVLTEVDLWEVSVVTFPMLPDARVSSVKSRPSTARDLERWLTRDAGLSRADASALLSGGWKAVRARRDVGAAPDTAPTLAAIRRATQLLQAR